MCISYYYYVAVLMLCGVASAFQSHPHIVETTRGFVEGITVRATRGGGNTYVAFRGIPYAQPPVKHLRFQAPEPPSPWSDVFNATKEPEPCIQQGYNEIVGSEDCLYLSVFTKELDKQPVSSLWPQPLRPVMVFIHGGHFMMGAPTTSLYGPDYLLEHDVVLVYIQYRLGAFGFFSTGDDVVPGNNGLKDQVVALRWVQENIAAFGGNPECVTIFGGDAGASSVHHHILSPVSKGLFHRAILQSGSALASWSNNPAVLTRSRTLATLLDCPSQYTQMMMDCLQVKDADAIIKSYKHMQPFVGHPHALFGPVVEAETGDGTWRFLDFNSGLKIASGDFEGVPMIVGVNRDEAAYIVVSLLENEEALTAFAEDVKGSLATILDYGHRDDVKDIMTATMDFYLTNLTVIDAEYTQKLTDLLSDALFVHSSYTSSVLHAIANVQPLYFYKLTYRGEYSITDFMSVTEEDYGVSHSDDILYIFRNGISEKFKKGSQERKLARLIQKMWVDFAETGNPTPNAHGSSFKWDPLLIDDEDHFPHALLKPQPTMENYFHQERMKFWHSLTLMDYFFNSNHDEL